MSGTCRVQVGYMSGTLLDTFTSELLSATLTDPVRVGVTYLLVTLMMAIK